VEPMHTCFLTLCILVSLLGTEFGCYERGGCIHLSTVFGITVLQGLAPLLLLVLFPFISYVKRYRLALLGMSNKT
jgi:hypothetical protein